ncbi:MAG: GNAT family N-acetyltransferase [Prevotella sp.]|nr:GNAT family N-acetyltransferase [Prevotella sp.]
MILKQPGQKLLLRALEPEDLDFLYSIENDAELWDFGCANVPYSKFSLNNYIVGSTCDIYADKQMRLLMENEDGKAVGLIDLFNFEPKHQRAEVGIVVAREYRNMGYGHEALMQIVAYARHTLHLHQVYAFVDVENDYSRKLFEGAGFTAGARLIDWIQKDCRYGDAVMMYFFM